MKIQIDTDKKIIRLESNILLADLVKTLRVLFPDNEWKKYILETNTVIQNWNAPIVIREYIKQYPQPYNPFPWNTYYSTNNNKVNAINSVLEGKISMHKMYNVELK